MILRFLGKIVRNLAFDRYKYNRAEKRGGGEIKLVLDELEECVSNSEDIEQAYETKELIGAINDFLAGLSKDKRIIFVCRYWYTDSIADIATRYRMTVPAVTMVLSRLRAELKTYLTERGYRI